MPIDAVKIPQNVYVEDRIIGPITLRQIIMMLVGAGISYGAWAMLQAAGYISLPYTVIAWTPAALAALFAFIKVNDISMFRMVLLFMEHLEKPNVRKWSPREGVSINILTTKHLGEEKREQPRKSFQADNVNLLSAMLDKGPAETENETPVLMQQAAPKTVEPAPVPQTETRQSRAVQPDRVRVETAGNLIDDISIQKAVEPTEATGGSLLRDIHPPRS